jgi:hypothetical protein
MKKALIILILFLFGQNILAQEPLVVYGGGDEILNWSQYYDSQPDHTSCTAGTLKDSEKQLVLQKINYIRSLHGLQPVEYDYSWDNKCSQSSLITTANYQQYGFGQGNHTPPKSWACWSQDGYDGASSSNLFISMGYTPPTVNSVINWMHDTNVESLGHRRWIINPFLKKIAIGRCDGDLGGMKFSCMTLYCHDRSQNVSGADYEYVAYPYHQYDPELVNKQWLMSFSVMYNKTNMFQNNNVNYSQATVKITGGGNTYTFGQGQVGYDNGNYGMPNCLKWQFPQVQEHVKYDVEITNVNVNGTMKNYTYWFELTDPGVVKPNIPALTEPANNADDVAPSVTFRWNEDPNAVNYSIQINTQNDFSGSLLVDDNTLTTNSFASSEIQSESTYYWRVKARNSGGESEWSGVWKFTTVKTPDIPTLSDPADNAENVGLTPVLTWNGVDLAESYQLQLNDTYTFDNPIVDVENIPTNSYEVPEGNLEIEKQYFWRVRSKGQGGYSNWSAAFKFSTVKGVPDAPTLSSPVSGEKNVSTTPTFSWEVSPGADTYNIQVSVDKEFIEEYIVLEGSSATNSYTVQEEDAFDLDKNHYWRVQAIGGGAASEWTNSRRFRTTDGSSVPDVSGTEMEFAQVMPNPFSQRASIKLNISEYTNVEILIFDAAGNLVQKIADRSYAVGEYFVEINGESLSQGSYFFVVRTEYAMQSGLFQIAR